MCTANGRRSIWGLSGSRNRQRALDHRVRCGRFQCPARRQMDKAIVRSKAERGYVLPCNGRRTRFGWLSDVAGTIRRACQLSLQHRSHRPRNFDETPLPATVRFSSRKIQQMAARQRAGTQRSGQPEARRSPNLTSRRIAGENLARRLTGTECHAIPLPWSKEYNKCEF